jgi:7-carboxy-7-deazaguanine synthase
LSLKITGIFQSIQGESSFAGWPCTFVRLCGCNLRCRYCDTTYAYEGGYDADVADVVSLLEDLPRTRLMEFTGGEPLLQEEAVVMANFYASTGRTVLVETNGSVDISVLTPEVIAIVDLKGPSSGESARMDLDNLSRLRPRDEVKFVIGGRKDWKHMLSLLPRIDTARNTVNVSPLFGALAPARLAGWLLAEGLDARLNLQQHKYIWEPDARDV